MIMKKGHFLDRIDSYYARKTVDETGILTVSNSSGATDAVFPFLGDTAIRAKLTLPFARIQFSGIFGWMIAFLTGEQACFT